MDILLKNLHKISVDQHLILYWGYECDYDYSVSSSLINITKEKNRTLFRFSKPGHFVINIKDNNTDILYIIIVDVKSSRFKEFFRKMFKH